MHQVQCYKTSKTIKKENFAKFAQGLAKMNGTMWQLF